MQYRITNGEVGAYLHTLVYGRYGDIIACSFFERTKSAVNGLSAWMKLQEKASCKTPLLIREVKDGVEGWRSSARVSIHSGMESYVTSFPFDNDRASMAFVYSKEIGKKIVITTQERKEDDLYSFLMSEYELPLLREWMPYIRSKLVQDACVDEYFSTLKGVENAYLPLRCGEAVENVPVEKLCVMRFLLNEAKLEKIVSEGLYDGKIRFTDKPQCSLQLGDDGADLNVYMERYGQALQENVDREVHPLVPLKGTVDGFAAKHKRLYPQQAAVVNGVIALMGAKERYAFMNCGMGCGKTMMGIASVEGRENQKWLAAHPGKTLRDMYLLPADEQPKYRAVVMPPPHLVDKWAREISEEVPGAKVTILDHLSQLVELRKAGKAPKGREWYVISKDFAKLDGGVSPIPTMMSKGKVEARICLSCEGRGFRSYIERDKKGREICPRCGEGDKKNFAFRPVERFGEGVALICPRCGKQLISANADINKADDVRLRPQDFSSRKRENDHCRHCGTPLWGYNCKPVGVGAAEPLWYKVSYNKNWTGKNRETAFVLKKHELAFYLAAELLDPATGKPYEKREVKKCDLQFSPRKVAPATFIKKYLDGYWDYVILDEVHKYSGNSGQMRAAHALVKTGKFSMGLTGTLTNGKADSLYYLFWMLDSRRMVNKGYRFESVMDFSKAYGCVQTVYEDRGGGYDGEYGRMVRGRQIKAPRTKPGINPVVYSEFLLGHAINMDLSDLSSHMPALREYVEVVPLPEDVRHAYNQASSALDAACKKKDGFCLMGETLNFCLSFPDKPYGRNPIMHPHYQDAVVLNPPSCDKYRQALLPKEERIVEIVNEEMEEGRNVFIFANFTGKEESNVTGRLKQVVEDHCNLRGRVMVLESSTPEARKREAFIHSKAKAGIKVVITNAKVCETGLDFCWEEDGVFYNYPTIIFAQPTYELATMMQSSRRHYRLNQTVECRTYWMAYEDTLQAAALKIMATKQVAASAIQGHFSAEGLASMAQGVDPRLELARKLSNGDNSSREELSGMFDVLAQANAVTEDELDRTSELQPLFFEVMGEDYRDEETEEQLDLLSLEVTEPAAEAAPKEVEGTAEETKPEPKAPEKESAKPKKPGKKGIILDGMMDFFAEDSGFSVEVVKTATIIPFDGLVADRKKNVKVAAGQSSFF